ncbi:putative structural protein [Rhizobium phage RHph_N17]|nr:putative structural protein [Rhizobium phage RHph_N17]
MEQYLRKVRLTAKGKGGSIVINPGALSMHELKIAFTITKSISSTQNSASIRIWNLSEATRYALGKELDDVTLEAGYYPPEGGNNVGIIFNGQIRDIEHSREGNDIISELSCGDADKAFRHATIAKTYPKGTEVKTVVDDIYKELAKDGVTKGEWKFPDNTPTFKRPYSVCGTCKRELDTLGRGKDFYWSVQNGVMEVVPGNGFIGGVVMLSSQTGLVDTPSITDNGVKAKALLNPEIRPNRRVQIISEVLEMNAENGMYRVGECTYSGDNRDGSEFHVSFTGEAIKGGKVDEGTWKDLK